MLRCLFSPNINPYVPLYMSLNSFANNEILSTLTCLSDALKYIHAKLYRTLIKLCAVLILFQLELNFHEFGLFQIFNEWQKCI